MSETDGAPRAWRLYVNDMIEFSENVQAYTAGLDEDGFLSDRRTYDATLRNLELIGEAATHIPKSVPALSAQLQNPLDSLDEAANIR